MGFKDMVQADNSAAFLNISELAEKRSIRYDGEEFYGIPVVLSGMKEKNRHQLVSDHVQGLYGVSTVLHCACKDLGGLQPEQGTRIEISDPENGAYRQFYVGSSVAEMGMLRVELEAIDE